jgi:hypothetical protein
MKRIGTLGYIILGLITTSAFAQTSPTVTAPAAAPAADTAPAKSGKHKGKKSAKKHGSHAHKKKPAPAAEQK